MLVPNPVVLHQAVFSVGTPLPGNKNNDGNLQFTVFRIDESGIDAVGVRAPKDDPTGAWGSTFTRRFGIMNAPK